MGIESDIWFLEGKVSDIRNEIAILTEGLFEAKKEIAELRKEIESLKRNKADEPL